MCRKQRKTLFDLNRKLGVLDGVLSMVDPIVDNTAFELVDIPVDMVHAETPKNLACDYFVRFEDILVFSGAYLKTIFFLTRIFQ